MKSSLALALLRLISFLPLGLARLLGRVVGATAVAARPYKVAKLNLSLCYPELAEPEIEELAKGRMAHFGQALFETPGLWRRSADWLQTKIIAVEGEAYLRRALANDRGTILLIPHQGNWEAVALWVAKQATITTLYKPPKLAALGDWIKRAREKTGANLVPTNVRGVAALLKALQRGEVTAILPDQQPPIGSGDFAPLFGVQALTMTLTHNLLKRSTSQAIFCCALREQGGWRLHFVPADDMIYSSDQATSLRAMNAGIESVVAMAPNQYQWEYKRFRARPEGSPPIYPAGT
ncbi:MAG: lysophospholipid acyltransferase family protein [Porticoccaceae bacterium]|nr:lysophospholipid acyltransferase family protein [Porticoccaceae bacterium]